MVDEKTCLEILKKDPQGESGQRDESLLSWKNRISLLSRLHAHARESGKPSASCNSPGMIHNLSGRHLTISSLPMGNEHILVVDDEPEIASLEQEILSILGYQVVPKTDSMEALDLFRENPVKFDLVITDLNMPSLEGDRLAQMLLDLRRDIPIILCTGSSKFLDMEKVRGLGIRECIRKPLGMKSLAETVRRVLDRE